MRWVERGVLLFAVVVLAQRFGPQLGAAVGVEEDLGRLPDFRVQTLDGATVTSEDLLGRVVLVNFWATWCAPCRVEMPGFQRVWEDHRERGFTIVGLATDREGPAVVEPFVRARGVSYPVAMSRPDLEAAFGGLRGLPMSYLIDRDGVVRHRIYGFFASPALRLAVGRLLDAPATGGTAASEEQVGLHTAVPPE